MVIALPFLFPFLSTHISLYLLQCFEKEDLSGMRWSYNAEKEMIVSENPRLCLASVSAESEEGEIS